MSKRRLRWWGNVLQMLRDYPLVASKGPRNPYDRRNQAAINRALQRLRKNPETAATAKETEQIVALVYYLGTHTVQEAGQLLGYSAKTCQRRISTLVFLIAEELGWINLSYPHTHNNKIK